MIGSLGNGFEKSKSALKHLDDLTKCIRRVRLTLKFLRSNSQAFDIINAQPKNKKDAILKQNLTNAYLTRQARSKFSEPKASL